MESQKPAIKMSYQRIKKVIFYSVGYIFIKWLIILIIGGALYKTGHWNNWYLAAVPLIGVTIFFIRRKVKTNKNQKKYVDN